MGWPLLAEAAVEVAPAVQRGRAFQCITHTVSILVGLKILVQSLPAPQDPGISSLQSRAQSPL
jgi:hypothetical protein